MSYITECPKIIENTWDQDEEEGLERFILHWEEGAYYWIAPHWQERQQC